MMNSTHLIALVTIVLQLYSHSVCSEIIILDSSLLAEAPGVRVAVKGQSPLNLTKQQTKETVQQTIFKWSMVDQIPELIANGKLDSEQIPNPHWKDDACLACHKNDAENASVRDLRKKSHDDLCVNCHDAQYDHSYIHPVNMKPDTKMMQNIKPEFRNTLLNADGEVGCSSCHNLLIQCLPERRKEAGVNRNFFRAGPFKTRTELCYFCHNEAEYRRLNPHDQIDDNGQLKENICRICHSGSMKKLKKATSGDEVGFHAKGNLSSMCWGCHRWSPHPGGQFTFFSNKPGPDHLVKPSENIFNTMKKASTEHEIALPLEPGSGKVYCGTCHNAHEKGVIKNEALAKGADENKRLRAQKICGYCHDK